MDLVTQQLPLIPEPEKPRTVILNNEVYVSILDVYRIYGKSNNPARDWNRDLKAMEEQGYKVPGLVLYQFPGSDGKLKRPTPIANEEQLARIAQTAKFKEWEPLRQEMAASYVGKRRAARKLPIPFQQTQKYRELREANYTHEQAMDWHDRDAIGVNARKRAVAEWVQRHGDVAHLTNFTTRLVTGKSATVLRREMGIKISPRAYMSSVRKTALAIVEDMGASLHRRRNSDGTTELARDLRDASQIIDWDKLSALVPDEPIAPPLPKGRQRALPAPKETRQ